MQAERGHTFAKVDEIGIKLFYCSTLLGYLEKTENEYVYTSNIPNEQMLKEKRTLTESEYGLWNSFKRESQKLFPDFEDLLKQWSRADILKRANITPEDSEWENLLNYLN